MKYRVYIISGVGICRTCLNTTVCLRMAQMLYTCTIAITTSRMHAHTHTCTYMHTHTHTQTHTHTLTHNIINTHIACKCNQQFNCVMWFCLLQSLISGEDGKLTNVGRSNENRFKNRFKNITPCKLNISKVPCNVTI